jgi:hypothetical protein
MSSVLGLPLQLSWWALGLTPLQVWAALVLAALVLAALELTPAQYL